MNFIRPLITNSKFHIRNDKTPSPETILKLLDRLDEVIADDLETEYLDHFFLRQHAEVDVNTASRITQLPEARVRDRLEQFCHRPSPWLERRGKKSGVTYHLARSVAAELIGKGVYSRSKAIDKVQWPVMIRQYVEEHGSINNSECRDLLLLGSSNSAQSTVSRLLANIEFLEPYGSSPKNRRYRLRQV